MNMQEYTFVVKSTTEELNAEVNKLLLQGWQLYGSPTIGGGLRLGQALVRVLIRQPV